MIVFNIYPIPGFFSSYWNFKSRENLMARSRTNCKDTVHYNKVTHEH
uniref:Uncharacterized protein n=1 Tax=Octopus bimaculoides TaxID=37653 RepID=A0A0L8GUA7_OCTBM